ncbi:hypothetical protein PAXRUDRAFT_167467 [Paxillus rubicundulus Ve08.2h10]|uniref:Uncharacterized protein n=1 Tax=Paxillus rubicundulus Ve08.2h10 TaxID=930991 RepID=A0A0D0C209_9AGAM|nr:hypothetical protein PAXRUDRAFT_167467 [Paxillus rubicundulus Ve08.2h10]
MDILYHLKVCPNLIHAQSLQTLFKFMNLVFWFWSSLYFVTAHKPPSTLTSPVVVNFLSVSCSFNTDEVQDTWLLLRDVIWNGDVPSQIGVGDAFANAGHACGIGEY